MSSVIKPFDDLDLSDSNTEDFGYNRKPSEVPTDHKPKPMRDISYIPAVMGKKKVIEPISENDSDTTDSEPQTSNGEETETEEDQKTEIKKKEQKIRKKDKKKSKNKSDKVSAKSGKVSKPRQKDKKATVKKVINRRIKKQSDDVPEQTKQELQNCVSKLIQLVWAI